MGGQPRPDRMAGLDHDDGVPVRAGRRPRLCLEEGGAGMGMSNTPDNPVLNPALHDRVPTPTGGQVTLPDNAYFDAVQAEVRDKGFIVTSTEDLFQWARTGSLWWMTFGHACCAVEMIHVNMPRSEEHTSELQSREN